MALHGFNDKAWEQHKAEHKGLRAGKRQVHLRKNFYRRGRGGGGGGGEVNVGMAFLTGDVSAAVLGTNHITLGEGTAKELQQDDPDDPTSWEAVGDEFTIYSKNPVLIRSGRAVTYQMHGNHDSIKIINDKDCG